MLEPGSAWPPDLDCEPLEALSVPPPASLWRNAGFFNPIHSSGLTVCGSAALLWANEHPPEDIASALAGSAAVLLDPVAATSLALQTAADRRAWRCQQSAHVAVASLRQAGSAAAEPTTCRHGVLLRVYGLGLLIEGAPASGKSELALALVDRGHSLVADDAVVLWRLAPNFLLGTCPEPLFGFLHTRSLGLLHLPSQFGHASLSPRTRVDLLVRLQAPERSAKASPGALLGPRPQAELAGGPLPLLILDGAAPASLALRIEQACREHWSQLKGWQANEALSQRQAELIHRSPAVAEGS